jgi:serine/threonine protein phosphatase PrpC
MKVYTHSEAGGHETNKDAMAATRYSDEPTTLVCALSDGQGGQPGGALAARITVDSCLKNALARPLDELLNPFTWQSIGGVVDRDVAQEPDAGYATFIGLAVSASFVAGASCGDSATVLLLGDKFVRLTEGQHKNPPIGSGAAPLTSFSARLDGSWKVIMMSDGVWKYAGWEAIIERCRAENGQELISGLREVAASRTLGKLSDDFSIVLIES